LSSIYVAKFSNGVIKVGRSVDPVSRIAQHEARVACMGVTLVEWTHYECVGSASSAETRLIEWCAERATRRFHSEWFEGVHYFDAVKVAEEFSLSVGPDKKVAGMDWQKLIADLLAAGITQKEIADVAGITQGRVSQISRDGGGLYYEAGVAIKAFHDRTFKPEKTAQ
jgi:hypothetical protein